MFTDTQLRLATNEVTPNGGATPGGIGAGSLALGLDLSGMNSFLRANSDLGGGRRVSLNVNVVTGFTCATFAAWIEMQLISLPINASLLTPATGTGATLTKTLVALSDTADTGTIVGHGMPLGTPIYLTGLATTTGVANATIYYVVPVDADTFKLATSLANALAGTTIDLTGGAGTATFNFIPTVHASTGSLLLFSAGVPTNQGPLRTGTRLVLPVQPIATQLPKTTLPAGQTLQQMLGAQSNGLIAAQPNRYYYWRYLPAATITAGAVTVDLMLDAEDSLKHYPTAVQLV